VARAKGEKLQDAQAIAAERRVPGQPSRRISPTVASELSMARQCDGETADNGERKRSSLDAGQPVLSATHSRRLPALPIFSRAELQPEDPLEERVGRV
jgi:hypothetical protein